MYSQNCEYLKVHCRRTWKDCKALTYSQQHQLGSDTHPYPTHTLVHVYNSCFRFLNVLQILLLFFIDIQILLISTHVSIYTVMSSQIYPRCEPRKIALRKTEECLQLTWSYLGRQPKWLLLEITKVENRRLLTWKRPLVPPPLFSSGLVIGLEASALAHVLYFCGRQGSLTFWESVPLRTTRAAVGGVVRASHPSDPHRVTWELSAPCEAGLSWRIHGPEQHPDQAPLLTTTETLAESSNSVSLSLLIRKMEVEIKFRLPWLFQLNKITFIERQHGVGIQ